MMETLQLLAMQFTGIKEQDKILPMSRLQVTHLLTHKQQSLLPKMSKKEQHIDLK